MPFNLTWEIGVLINSYAEKIEPLKTEAQVFDYEKYKQGEALKSLYARAIELTCKKRTGLTMPIDMAISWVTDEFITDYDGFGNLFDKDGNKIGSMHCDVDFLKNAKENGACFVAWYNK